MTEHLAMSMTTVLDGASAIKVMCTQALTEAMHDLVPGFERELGQRVVASYGTTGAIVGRIKGGEAFDVVIVTATALGDLAALGRVAPESRVDVARVGLGLAVRDGAPKPDLSSVAALKRALIDAASIAYADPASGGASGIVFAGIVDLLGLTAALAPKARLVPADDTVSAVIARGEAELGVQMVSELVLVPGVDFVGRLPAELQTPTVFAGALAADAARPDAARAFLMLLSSPKAASVLRAKGLDPA